MIKKIKLWLTWIAFSPMVLPAIAFAGGTGMPYETPMNSIVDSLSGPVLRAIIILAIIAAGASLAIGFGGGIFRRIAGVVFGLALAAAAVSWGPGFFGFGGGVLI